MGVKQLYSNIKNGKLGKNIGISTGIPKLDSIIYGIQRKYLYVIAADQGGGKTSFAIDSFVYNLYKNRGEHKINILYYSFEMSADVLYAKILSRYIYDTFGKVITYETILSLTTPISEEDYSIILQSESWLSEFQEFFTIYDRALTPQAIYATCKGWLSQFGEFIQIDDHKEEYREYDSSSYKIALIDHMRLIAGNESVKSKIDLVCDYFVYFRNKCNMSGVFVQQINRNSKSVDRKQGGYELLQLDDLADSSGPAQSAEVVIMLYYPYREKIARCEGYPIQNILKNKGRIIQICKNRYGRSDINIGCVFHGEIGMFVGLPKPEEISDYDPYLNLIDTINYIPDNKKEHKDENLNDLFIL